MSKKSKVMILIASLIAFLIILYGLGSLGYAVISNLGRNGFSDSELEINSGYLLNKTSAYTFSLSDVERQTFAIEPNIEEFNHNEDFIIARTTSKNIKSSSYWIIDVKKDTLYGPLREEDFSTKRNELSVELELIETSNFFR